MAFFACSFLSVSVTIPAKAEESAGTIEAIDKDRALITLDDGNVYELPGEFDYAAVEPGMQVVVIYDEVAAERVQPTMRLVG
nr:DUF1344 domain-containing protein [Mangrovicella endophytica]